MIFIYFWKSGIYLFEDISNSFITYFILTNSEINNLNIIIIFTLGVLALLIAFANSNAPLSESELKFKLTYNSSNYFYNVIPSAMNVAPASPT
jgi:hypothetical protein